MLFEIFDVPLENVAVVGIFIIVFAVNAPPLKTAPVVVILLMAVISRFASRTTDFDALAVPAITILKSICAAVALTDVPPSDRELRVASPVVVKVAVLIFVIPVTPLLASRTTAFDAVPAPGVTFVYDS